MITIPLMVIATLYLALLVWLGFKLKSWPLRITVLLILLSPVIYWVGSYQYVQYEHGRDCAREGGLKVFVQPEKTDRIRLDMDSSYNGAYSAEFLLRNLHPKLVVVEAWDSKYNGKGEKTGYFAYSLDPVTTGLPKTDWKIVKRALTGPTSGLYVISQSSFLVNEVEKTTVMLSKNNQKIAAWTTFYHYWSRNGAMNIGWRCFYQDVQTKDPALTLSELILK
jgi:hypothetical protein